MKIVSVIDKITISYLIAEWLDNQPVWIKCWIFRYNLQHIQISRGVFWCYFVCFWKYLSDEDNFLHLQFISCNMKSYNVSTGPVLYDLYAICNHTGNVNMGHYTACCLDENGWCFYNDSRWGLPFCFDGISCHRLTIETRHRSFLFR